MLLWSLVELDWLMSCQECAGQFAVVPSPGIRVTVAESLSFVFIKVSEWCDLWGMKFNVRKTKTIIVSWSCKMHSQSPALTIGGTVLKESDDLVLYWEGHLIPR